MKTTLTLLSINLATLVMCFGFAPQYPLLIAIMLLAVAVLSYYVIIRQQQQQQRLLTSLEHGLQSLRDNDFSISLSDNAAASHQKIIAAFNQTSEKLRGERQYIYQREMLLDKVLNASPMVMILVDHRNRVTFTNHSAQQTFAMKGSIVGHDWDALVDSLPMEFQGALKSRGESIITLTDKQGQQQAWHIATSTLTIHQAPHQLYLLKSITQELSKQEVATWKKVISVISHELNNSIAPISSMCHSGELLAKNLQEPRLNRVFNTISKRVNHLNDFIKGYASLTQIKRPNVALLNWQNITEQLNGLYPFKLLGELPQTATYGDEMQLEQVFINVLKNAHEADESGAITMRFSQKAQHLEIEVCDTGEGMPAEVIKNALLPFYSTKHSGTGLGLALCKEIIEAHQGKLIFNNLPQLGLSVTIVLPYYLEK